MRLAVGANTSLPSTTINASADIPNRIIAPSSSCCYIL